MSAAVRETAAPLVREPRTSPSARYSARPEPGYTRPFTVDDLAGLGRLTPDEAARFLADFADAGVCEWVTRTGYRLTERGPRIAIDIAGIPGDES